MEAVALAVTFAMHSHRFVAVAQIKATATTKVSHREEPASRLSP
jgi:hypothetical protein